MRDKYVLAMLGEKPFTTHPVWQWDKGLVLTFPASSAAKLPESYEMHWSNSPRGKATVQIGNRDGVLIPEEYINTGRMVYGWVYVPNEDGSALTVYDILIPVVQRAQPTDYEPTPVEQTAIDQAIAALNAAVAKCESAVGKTPHPENGVWVVWNAVTGEWESTGISAQGPQGIQGERGEPGSEYTVMIQNDEPSERSNKIWIPDTDGQTVIVPTVDSDGNIEFEGAISIGRKSSSSKGNKSVAIGNENSATGAYSVAFGENSNATSRSAFAFGLGVSATDAGTMVIGAYNKSLGTYRSWVPNYNNILGAYVIRNRKVYRCIVPNNDATFDESKWEVVPWGGPRAFIIGNGTENNKSNAMVVDWRGNLELAGNLTIGSTSITEAQLQALLSLIS